MRPVGPDSDNEIFMQRAFQLAALGQGYVSPNPMVGCVIARDGKIIGEGWHKRFGEPHAEVNAVASVTDKAMLAGSTVYVTLEPCSHFGKTPPCADLLVREKVGKVVISNMDSNPLVAGKGIQKLRDAGIEVVTGVLEKTGRHFNRRFFTFIEKKRPYVILKWAQTADGFIARDNFDSKWISNEYSRQLVHKWRAEEDAVLVGTQTARYDDPRLNVRDWSGNDPVRLVIDRNLKLPKKLNLFDGSQKTFCYNLIKDSREGNVGFVKLSATNFLQELLNDLHARQIQSLLIEGGAGILRAFMDAGLWDEARVFVSARSFEKGIAAPQLPGAPTFREQVSSDVLHYYFAS